MHFLKSIGSFLLFWCIIAFVGYLDFLLMTYLHSYSSPNNVWVILSLGVLFVITIISVPMTIIISGCIFSSVYENSLRKELLDIDATLRRKLYTLELVKEDRYLLQSEAERLFNSKDQRNFSSLDSGA